MKALLVAAVVLGSLAARAQGVQICVGEDLKDLTAQVSDDHVTLADGTELVPPATDLEATEDMEVRLEVLTKPKGFVLDGVIPYTDEPQVYAYQGHTLLCSSTMSEDEFTSLAK